MLAIKKTRQTERERAEAVEGERCTNSRDDKEVCGISYLQSTMTLTAPSKLEQSDMSGSERTAHLC